MERGTRWSMKLFQICSIFWTSHSLTGNPDAHRVSQLAGSTVKLPCSNRSLNTLTQVTWRVGQVGLFSYQPGQPVFSHPPVANLTLSMELNATKLYALVIPKVKSSNAGNFTCVTSTSQGVWEEKWELQVTEPEANEVSAKVVIVHGTVGTIAFVCIAVVSWFSVRACMLRDRNEVSCPSIKRSVKESDYKEEAIYQN